MSDAFISDAFNAASDAFNAQNAIQDASDASDAFALEIYLGQNKRLASEVIEGDSVAVAVAGFMQSRQTWLGTATELLSSVSKPESTQAWPKSPHALTIRLKRLAPALRTMGINVDYQRDSDRMRTRRIHLTAKPVESPER